MKKIVVLVFSLLISTASIASATSYTADFLSSTSIIVSSLGFLSPSEVGYFWSASRGDQITQTFSSTGLPTVNELSLDFAVTTSVLSQNIDWNVYLNNILVGDWVWTPSSGTGTVNLDFTFSDISASSYKVSMVVSNEVAAGNGSIAIGVPGTVTLSNDGAAPVPEPGTLALLGLGMAGLAIYGRRHKNSKV